MCSNLHSIEVFSSLLRFSLFTEHFRSHLCGCGMLKYFFQVCILSVEIFKCPDKQYCLNQYSNVSL